MHLTARLGLHILTVLCCLWFRARTLPQAAQHSAAGGLHRARQLRAGSSGSWASPFTFQSKFEKLAEKEVRLVVCTLGQVPWSHVTHLPSAPQWLLLELFPKAGRAEERMQDPRKQPQQAPWLRPAGSHCRSQPGNCCYV